MPLARAAVGAVPSLRGVLRRGGAQPAAALPLTPALLTGTIEESLRRLGTDHLDLYALHGVAARGADRRGRSAPSRTSAPPARPGRWRWRATRAAGLAAIATGAPFGVVQAATPAPGRAPTRSCPRRRAAGFGVVLHSVFGIDGSLAALKARAAADPAFRAAVTGGAGDLDRRRSPRRLLARALALNPDGVVLVSMFSERSRAGEPRRRRGAAPADAGLLDRLAASAGGGGIALQPLGPRPPDVAPHRRGLGEARAAAEPRQRPAARPCGSTARSRAGTARAAAARPGSAGGSASPAPSAS